MRRDLTDAYLRTLRPPPDGRLELRDARVVGLVFRLTGEGKATWSLRTRTREGKHTRPTLGTWPAMGIAAARRTAQARLVEVQQGGDPVADARAARAARTERQAAPTVAARVEEWLQARERDPSKPLAPRTAVEYRRAMLREVVPRLGKAALAETTRADWTALVAAKRATAPAMAASLLRTCSAFLGYAEAHGWVATALLPRKATAVLAPSADARDRALTDAELREVWAAAGLEEPKTRAFVRLLILTAARELEVADIAVGEVDRAAGRWTLPGARTKNKLGITLPLDALALAELAAVWPDAPSPAPGWRLLGRTKGGGFRGFSRLKGRLDARIAAAREGVGDPPMPPWRWHDLRRTARTGMARLGVARDHAEAALNHVSGRSGLVGVYDRHTYAAEVVAALGVWQGHVAGVVIAPISLPAGKENIVTGKDYR